MDIVILDKTHYRKAFECEEQQLTQYIQKQVSQDVRKKLAICFVAIDANNHVVGYYTLSSESLGREQIPEKYIKKVPQNYNVPVILLGRLARDLTAKGTGLGEHLLLDALFRAFTLSEESIGAMAVVVDPINTYAVNFYRKYGFEQLPDSEKMFIPMNTIRQII
ncbi:Acetyltransferase (GNAT) family protein [Cyclobacterium xiamenense]|uniref:Acetyltransferase (GNAT) family protein n=1 Tax=Cyclobacterium xiamenense TaxID=1297121 RepID=A0A1H6VL46_9BACT|nr:GNAT family N-acetyltransferase [Cyclobacterium xiamenense]SEJ03714.1 Acetyltransferase (GNAT) family protein [Cyclobacterium xiamenense]